MTKQLVLAALWSASAFGAITGVTITPSNGSGTTNNFTVTIADSAGGADVAGTYVLFNTAQQYAGGCSLALFGTTMEVYNDVVDGWGIAHNGGDTITESECGLTYGTAVSNAAGWTYTFSLTFLSTMPANVNIYAQALPFSGATWGYNTIGTYAGRGAITGVTITPSTGSGTTNNFTVTVADSAGGADVAGTYVLFNTTQQYGGGCSLAFLGTEMDLYNDVTQAWGGVHSGTITESQCSLTYGTAVSSAAGWTYTFSLTFLSTMPPNVNIYAQAFPWTGSPWGYGIIGAYSVNSTSSQVQTPILTYHNGETFTFTAADSAGGPDAAILISWSNQPYLTWANSCVITAASTGVRLLKDDASGWTSISPAAANSQCIVTVQDQEWTSSPVSLTVSVVFANAYANRQIWGETVSNSNWSILTGWQALNSLAPPVVALPVVSSSDLTNYSVSVADSASGADAEILLSWSNQPYLTWTNSCVITAAASTGVRLLKDDGSGWLPIAPSASNSQCTVTLQSQAWNGPVSAALAVGISFLNGYTPQSVWGYTCSASNLSIYLGWNMIMQIGTTQNTAATLTMTLPPPGNGIDDSSGYPMPIPDPNNPAAMLLTTSRGKTVSFRRGDLLNVANFSWSYQSVGDQTRYTYTVDNRELEIMRIGEDFTYVESISEQTAPPGWSPLGVAFFAGSSSDVTRLERGVYTTTTNWHPGLVAVFLVSAEGMDSLPLQDNSADNERLAEVSGIVHNSLIKLAIGPAFSPSASKDEVVALVKHWVKDLRVSFLQPYLDGHDLTTIQPTGDLEQQILDTLAAELQRAK